MTKTLEDIGLKFVIEEFYEAEEELGFINTKRLSREEFISIYGGSDEFIRFQTERSEYSVDDFFEVESASGFKNTSEMARSDFIAYDGSRELLEFQEKELLFLVRGSMESIREYSGVDEFRRGFLSFGALSIGVMAIVVFSYGSYSSFLEYVVGGWVQPSVPHYLKIILLGFALGLFFKKHRATIIGIFISDLMFSGISDIMGVELFSRICYDTYLLPFVLLYMLLGRALSFVKLGRH